MYPWKTLVRRPAFWGFFLFAAVTVLWLTHPVLVGDAARDGLQRCGMVLIPALFPFFVLSNLFVRRKYHRCLAAALRPVMGPLFGLNGAAAGALAMGAVGGYPIGAATAFSLYDRGELSAQQTSRLLAFCNNAGPGFIFGVAGVGIFHSVRAGALLLSIHLLSAAMTGAAFRAFGGIPAGSALTVRTARSEGGESFAESFVGSIRDAATTMVQVCAFLVFFSVLLAFLDRMPPVQGLGRLLQTWMEPETAASLLGGLVELSTGIGRLSAAGESAGILFLCCAFELGWGGLCVHMQVLSLRAGRSIPMTGYWLGKLSQGVLSVLWSALLLYGRTVFVLLFPACWLLLILVPRRNKTSTGKLRVYRV